MTASPTELTSHRGLVEAWRETRERQLREPTSRVREILIAAGHGPRYYPIDPAYRVPVALDASPEGARVRRERISGEEDDHALFGILRGSIGGRPFALEATRTLAGTLSIAFRDTTCGADSYGFRYVTPQQDSGGAWWLDFNLAHNPLCAYGDGFRCVLPPAGNTLALPLRVGERRFHFLP